jgi:hypothetical protein
MANGLFAYDPVAKAASVAKGSTDPYFQMGALLGSVGGGLLGLFPKENPEQKKLREMFEGIGETPTPEDLFKVGRAFLDYDPELGARFIQEGRLLQESMAKKPKVSSPGSPVLREVKSAVDLLKMDPDLSGEGIRNIGLSSEEAMAAGREIAARARELQKQYAAEGSTLNYTEAEQVALDMMKQEGLFQQSEKLGGAFRTWSYMPKQMQEKAITMQPGEQREVVERRTKDGKIGLFDANTKEFIGYK